MLRRLFISPKHLNSFAVTYNNTNRAVMHWGSAKFECAVECRLGRREYNIPVSLGERRIGAEGNCFSFFLWGGYPCLKIMFGSDAMWKRFAESRAVEKMQIFSFANRYNAKRRKCCTFSGLKSNKRLGTS